MAIRFQILFFLVVVLAISSATALISSESFNPSASKAISDLRDAIERGLGFQGKEGLKVSGFDVRDALVGQSVAYEFDVEVDKKTIPIKLLEDVNRWDFVDLPMFRTEEGEEKGLAEFGKRRESSRVSPVLSPFQLAGPMELWIQDGDDLRLSLPHDVEAGTLKKVILSDGAVVTVKGARSVSLRHPLELPLPLNRTYQKGRSMASGLMSIAEALRNTARSNEKPLLSLRIVGPTSLTSSPSTSPNDKLKLRLLAPGLVELSARSVPAVAEDVDRPVGHGATLWPLTSLNSSNSNLRGFEELLASVLGKKGEEEGSFKLVRAEVSARNYLKMGFSVEKRLLEEEVDWSGFPEWKMKPEEATSHFEVIARIEDNGKVIPERIAQVQPVVTQDTISFSAQTGNISFSQLPIVHPPPVYFTL
ncbi:hypothetical protein J5N97_010137 [Dioscorea zingiberensis]|uniref:Tunicamycin induced 1 n=1 Tax=Dioscorea zingiberensis TaxID=325984 RepID=A0A9D5D035_9LILI|nr:hypothetical protein J5N97_010137 [Dioscorea zingiberensis]